MDLKNEAKFKCFPEKIKILSKKEIQPYLKYAKLKYNSDYILPLDDDEILKSRGITISAVK